MQMRPSRVLDKLRKGEVVTSFKINLADSRAVEIASAAGFDCIFADMEHVANDFSAIERQVLAAKYRNVDVMVRVARGGYSDYIRPLELDAAGVMVPHVMSLEDAKRVVRITRFPPLGRRAVDGGNADGAFCEVPFTEYLKQANQERFVAIQIEDPEPLDELEAIAALDGIDVLFFGPGDFSCGIGAPGDSNHPLVVETRRRIPEVAARHGKFAGTVAAPGDIPHLVSLGYRLINCGADVLGLTTYCKSIFAAFQSALAPASKQSK